MGSTFFILHDGDFQHMYKMSFMHSYYVCCSFAGSSARIMVRTCNGLELRDPTLLAESSASELVDSTHTTELFPTLDSHDEFNPR
jgi:hypothetical protein